MLTPDRLAAYLTHIQTTGNLNNFGPTARETDAAAVLLVAILEGALPTDPTANLVRDFHAAAVDGEWLETIWETMPQWGRGLMIVQDSRIDGYEQNVRRNLVTHFLLARRKVALPAL